MRIGMGYDVHKLTEDRKLIMGGVEIPHEKGLLGHSDADVLVHAIMDALLGAAALGDINNPHPRYFQCNNSVPAEDTECVFFQNGYEYHHQKHSIFLRR